MKRNYFLMIFMVIFIFIVSFTVPSLKYGTRSLKSGGKSFGVSKQTESLDTFMAKNFIEKDSIVKIDDNYYSLKDDNRLIDLNSMEFVNSNDTIKDEKAFKELRKKYPLFIVESIINTDYVNFNIFDNMIYVAYNSEDGKKYDVTLICNDYKDLVDFNCKDDIQEDPNVLDIDPNQKIVALTFDDGPCIYTNSVIEQLNNFNMKATFFELGNLMERYPEIVKRVKENGFEIGSHGYSHKAFTKLKVDGTIQELNRTNEIYKNITGEDIKMVRPPYGSINASIRDSIPTTFVKWSVDSLDWKVKDERYVENIMSTVKDGDIILVHDIQKTTAEHLSSLLTKLYNEGFRVVTVSELASVKGINLEVNKVYFNLRNS